MAFRSLIDGECSDVTPLVKLTSHVTEDHIFADHHGQLFPDSSDQLVEQFLQETLPVPQSFRMEDLMKEMREIESQQSILPPVPASAIKDQLHEDLWTQQCKGNGEVSSDLAHEAIWTEISSQEQNNVASILQSPCTHPTLDNAIWSNELQRDAQELADSVDDKKFIYSKFVRFIKNLSGGEVTFEEVTAKEQEAESWNQEFQSTVQGSSGNYSTDDWSKEHKTAITSDDFNSLFWDNLQEEMKKASNWEDSTHNHWLSEFSNHFPLQDYIFTEWNPMSNTDNALEKGKELLEQGDFPSAVLCFEVAVKNEPQNDEAWLFLGTTQAENEQDPNAIPALRRCLQVNPGNLKALMALAVSLTNESYYNQACETLLQWLKVNPKYCDLVPPDFRLPGQVKSLLDPNDHEVVQNIFIKAAQRHPQDIDYEVQCGLGVLFNLSNEYDKAADCFHAALSVKPEDARLWNRLGATLANGMKPEEAVHAYHQALSISPGYIRARYNVGITCINLSAYSEAAEHFLTALNQQARSKSVANSGELSQMSDTIWSTLRMCVSLMNRTDLRPAVDNRDLDTLNTAFNIVEL